jgi:hypothetical protein
MNSVGVEIDVSHRAGTPWFCVVGLLLTACSIGPKFQPDFPLPKPSTALHDRKVIVSGFQGARYATSVTRSADIQTFREEIGTRDVSADVAQYLQGRGVNAEARVGFTPAMLGQGEVLLRGKVSAFGGPGWAPGRGLNWANFGLVVCTLGIIGMIAPTPIPWIAVVEVSYSADVVDAEGRFLAHASEQKVEADFNSYWFWGVAYGDVNERTFAASTTRVSERLADWFAAR